MNPRASAAATTSTRRFAANAEIWLIADASASASSSSGVMSLKTIPGFGKSGMSRM
jgi:phosphotransferase system HPr-like phosphotransfer protein